MTCACDGGSGDALSHRQVSLCHSSPSFRADLHGEGASTASLDGMQAK